MARRQHLWLCLFPVGLVGAGLAVAELAHVDGAEVDGAGMVRQPVHDRIRCDTIGERFDPIAGPGLGRDQRGQAVFPVRQHREQIVRGVAVDADGEEVIDDEQIHVGELVKELLVGDAIAAGDDESAGEVVHPRKRDGVLVEAGADTDRAGEIGFPAPGGRDDQQVRRIGPPGMGSVATHSHPRDTAAFLVVDLRDRRVRDGELRLPDQFLNPAVAALLQRVIDRGQKQLFRGEGVIDFVLDEFLETGRDVGDAQGPELVVIDAGEHHLPSSSRA